jgi:L-seryl-tRNA(Ser) seleniumtransferase
MPIMEDTPLNRLRTLPAVEVLLRHPLLDSLRDRVGHVALVRLVRQVVAAAREALQEGRNDRDTSEAGLARAVADEAGRLLTIGPVPVVNATGVLLHTNLGRAPLSAAAVDAVTRAAAGYSNLEYDLAVGARGSRMTHVERLLAFLCRAEAAMVVNNNAAAVLLSLNALAEGREVLVSRGELVEIGGSFRIPDILAKSGARLVEVGTTNKTHRKDYERAIGPASALLLKVHTSNYRIEGFTAEVPLAELAELGQLRGLPVLVDLGSGALLDVSTAGVPAEPMVGDCLAEGADIVTFSGDKLLGGPQAGLIVGRRDLIRRLRENPLARALRPDKMTLAALAATLVEFLNPEAAWANIPALAMLGRTPDELEAAAARLAERLEQALPGRLSARVLEAEAAVGGGALPLSGLVTRVVAVAVSGLSPDALEKRLRAGEPPVIVRIQNDRVLFDLRTLSADDAERLPGLVARAAGS